MARHYAVLCHGLVGKCITVCVPLLQSCDEGIVQTVVDYRGKPTLSWLKPLAALERQMALRHGDSLCLVAIRILTGRKHQIRAHLLYAWHPVVSDKSYAHDRIVLMTLGPENPVAANTWP